MREPVAITQKVYFHFLQSNPGKEREAANALQASGHTCPYKTLGAFDIVSVVGVEAENDYAGSISHDSIRFAKHLLGCGFRLSEYTTPNLNSWLIDCSLFSFSFFEIDKQTNDCHSDGTLTEAIALLLHIAKDCGVELAILLGLGKSELLILAKASELSQIWLLTKKCRAIKYRDVLGTANSTPFFSKSTTFPCISFNNVIYDGDAIRLEGDWGHCNAEVSVTAPPGMESLVNKFFGKNKDYTTFGALGVDDVIIHTKNPVRLSELVRNILLFRRESTTAGSYEVSTATRILDDSHDPESSTLHFNPGPCIQANTGNTDAVKQYNPLLHQRLHNILHSIANYSRNQSHKPLIINLQGYVDYLFHLMKEFESICTNDTTGETIKAQAQLLHAAEVIEHSLSQRLGSTNSVICSNHSSLTPFGDGLHVPLQAVEFLIRTIFKTWISIRTETVNDSTQDPNWLGFAAFSDSFNFQLTGGEVIFLPTASILSPMSDAGNWHTLTHEISHAIFVRLRVIHHLDKEIRQVFENGFATNNNTESRTNIFDDLVDLWTPYIDQISELFAHWYDYYHFYNSDLDLYLTTIWRSWLCIPIVHINFSNYFFRSFAIYISSHMDEATTAYRSGYSHMKQWINAEWINHRNLLLASCISDRDVVNIDRMDSKLHNLADLAIKLFPILLAYRTNFSHDSFKKEINKPDENQKECVSCLLRGEIMYDRINNPLSLFRQLKSETTSGNSLATTAMLISFRNAGRISADK